MTTALLVQGPWHSRWLDRFDQYVGVFDQIVVSTYSHQIKNLMCWQSQLSHPKVTVILSPSWFPSGADSYGNVWYQCLTTLAGLRAATSDHVIKSRTDECWSNLQVMKRKIKSTNRFASVNIYFKRPEWFPYHIGDHLFGGPTSLMTKGFEILERDLLVDGFGNSRRAAEQKICTSLLTAAGESTDWNNPSAAMLKWWTIQPARELEPFWFNAPSVGTVGTTQNQVAECEQHNLTVELFDHINSYYKPI
jgi:hypothetical protein